MQRGYKNHDFLHGLGSFEALTAGIEAARPL